MHDILGRAVATLVDLPQEPGRYQVQWDASGIASGVYFYTLRTEQGVLSRRMILLR